VKAIIGGTGIYSIDGNDHIKKIVVPTPYGEVELEQMQVSGIDIVFLARHGKGHKTPPHMINYRANLKALQILGVDEVLATCAVGSCHESIAPGELVLINDFLDFTKARTQTDFDGTEGVAHLDVSNPYCLSLQEAILKVASDTNLPIHKNGVYVCTEGPRFETATEIKMFRTLGGDVVGMTNFPEVVLAKELGLCYAAVGFITNWCTGVKQGAIEMHDIEGSIGYNRKRLTELFMTVLTREPAEKNCRCKDSLIRL
jgi:5'-methylthioadenosine phosphorylase